MSMRLEDHHGGVLTIAKVGLIRTYAQEVRRVSGERTLGLSSRDADRT